MAASAAKSRSTPDYSPLRPASERASRAARGSSKKRDTRCEILLRRELWRLGVRYRVAVPGLPGRPDIVLTKPMIAIFCDGDFWHGRDLDARLAKLGQGHNGAYWVNKIQRNAERDRQHDLALAAAGWKVLRFWEKDILKSPVAVAEAVAETIRLRGAPERVPLKSPAQSQASAGRR